MRKSERNGGWNWILKDIHDYLEYFALVLFFKHLKQNMILYYNDQQFVNFGNSGPGTCPVPYPKFILCKITSEIMAKWVSAVGAGE